MILADETFWADRRVFVTGCTGFLGTWLTRQLADLRATVVGLVRDIPAQVGPIAGLTDRAMTSVFGRVEDLPLLERVVNEYEIDTVFHLAAQPIVGTADRSPISTYESNIRGTWNLLEACRRVGTVERIVIASSDKAYGTHRDLPYTEDMPLHGSHPYDVSKSCADLIAQAYHRSYGLPVCITRCGNFFGGGDLNFNRIIPGTIRSVLMGRRPVIRSDGTFVRDYIYIRDVLTAYLGLAHKMDDPALHGQAFNFSLENQVTVLELTDIMLAQMGRADLAPIVLDEAGAEIRHQYLSAAKARRVLGWKPCYSLEEALSETIEWYRAYFKGAATEEPAAVV